MWMRSTAEEYKCDLLFVHRDADADGRPKRLEEIARWTAAAGPGVSVVPSVPVRETEAWLLIEENAIRAAALNRNGRAPLQLPALAQIERLDDPKSVLADLLRTASGLTGSRLRAFDVNKARGRIEVTDIARLRRLAAFAAFEQELAGTCSARGWAG